MKSRALALAAALAVVVGLTAPATAADAAVKRPVAKVAAKKAVAKKPAAKKADPCSPAEVAKVYGVKPLVPAPAGLTYLTTRTAVDRGYNAGSPTPRRWVNYRGYQVWLSTAVCGTIYTHVYVYSDGKARPWV